MAAVDERKRHKLYLAAEQSWGAEEAETLMSMIPPVGWADVATKDDLALMKHDLKQEMSALENRLDAKFERRFHEMTRTFVTWLLTAQASTVALVVAAIAFFR